MANVISAPIFAICLFVAMLLLLEIGRRVGVRRMAGDSEDAKPGLSTLKGVVFGLTSLILAFSFAGALSRYDARRQLIVEEANAIGTAYLRVDLLPSDSQPALRERFRSRYVDSRLEVYKRLPDVAAAQAELNRSKQLQNEIWASTITAIRGANSPATTTLVIGALNEMIDITSTRTVAALSHPPLIIFAMIFFLMLGSALIAGQDMATSTGKDWLHRLALALILTVTVYVITEIEHPRAGLIRLDVFDAVLAEAREAMK